MGRSLHEHSSPEKQSILHLAFVVGEKENRSQCSLLVNRLPCYLIRNCFCFMGWYFRFLFSFFVNKKFLGYAFCLKKIKSWIFWIFKNIFEYVLNRYTAFLTRPTRDNCRGKCRRMLGKTLSRKQKSCPRRFCMAPRYCISTRWYFDWNIFLL